MIEFIDYTGKYPTLCMGILTVKINDKTYKFGENENTYNFTTNTYKEDCYPQFWTSGGSVEMRIDDNDEMITYCGNGDWQLNSEWNNIDETHPQYIRDLLPELIKVFNKNVIQGCCGGCI